MANEIKGIQQTQINRQIDQDKTSRPDNRNAGNLTKEMAITIYSDSDQVSLTDTAGRLRLLQEQVADQPVVDNQRVESIKKAIADGSFRVNVNETAEKMIGLERLLQGALKKE